MFSKIFRFGQKKQAKKVHVSDSDDDFWLENFHVVERGLPNLESSQIRLLVYKDHDNVFDSKTDLQDDVEEQNSGNGRPPRKRVSPDVQLFGEMIFGSVEMTYKGPTVKAHSIRTPPQLLLTKVFALKPPRASHHGGSSTTTSNSSSEYSSSIRFSESISSVSSFTSPVTSSDNEDSSVVAKSVPVSSISSNFMTSPRSFQLQNIAEGFSNSKSESSQSLTFPRASSSSYQRRWLRSQMTRMDYGCMRRNDYFNEEMSMRLRRRPKIGIGILFTLWEGKSMSEENNRLFQNFVFSHFPLFESHIHRLKRMVEKALLSSVQMSGRSFQEALFGAANTFARNILNLYYTPRIRNPLWLTMLSQPDQCNTICDDLVPQIVNAVELYNTKQTNFFLSSLLTAVLTYHVAWVTTVTPSSELARRAYLDKHSSETLNLLSESHPYNPLWAQLSELYGACGDPPKMARTVILGQDQQIVTIILHILSYFIRCSEVFEQPLEQKPKNLTSYLDSVATQVDEKDTSEEINCQVKPKYDTISEKSENFSSESKRYSKESKTAKYSENLSQSPRSHKKDSNMKSEKLLADSKSSSLNCKCDQSENIKNSRTKSHVENFDSCGEDSGICSTDFDSSVEVLRNDAKECVNGFKDGSEGPGNCLENSKNCSHDSKNCTRDIEKCSQNSMNCERNVGKGGKHFSEDSENFVQDCENCFRNSTNRIQHNPDSQSTEDKLCVHCSDLGVQRNSKEHKLWKSFLRTSCCNKNSKSLDRRCLTNSFSENIDTSEKFPRRYSSEKRVDYQSETKLCVKNDGKILSLDRQRILDTFLSSYPLCPICEGQLNFVDQDLAGDMKVFGRQSSVCLCQDCDKVKSCSCQVVNSELGENGRCVSSLTVSSDYSSGISLQSFEAELGSLSRLSVDSGLNEQPCENLVRKCAIEEQPFPMELPEAEFDEHFSEDDMSCKNSQDCQLFSFGRSLMAGYCDQYVPDFVLHGTDRCTEEQAKQSLQVSLEQPVVDSPISESVLITGDTDKWECTVKTLANKRKGIGNHPSGVRSKKAERSNLVHDFLISFCDLWELNMPATFCLMHLEDKMKELYLRSKVVSEYLLTQKYVTMRDLMSTFGYSECDLALIMSIVGVHSPLAISRIPPFYT